MGLPVIVERNAWTLPQERYNAEWVESEGVGIVVPTFKNLVQAIEKMLAGGEYERFKRNAKALDNRAVFEIPDLMQRVMSERGAY